MASPAPLRSWRPSRSTPLIRVWAVKGTNSACSSPMSCSRIPYCLASTTIERPSGVSSASEESWATSASSASETPGMGMNSEARRLPIVIVPVLSSSSTSTSPEASTARPDSASTLRRTSRSMPAIPIADSSAPIVVGISATSSEMSVVSEIEVRANSPNGRSVATTIMKIRVRPASRMLSAISFGVLRRCGALDQRDHPVQEGVAGLLGDLDHDPVRQHAGAAGDRAAVAAGLADDRGRLAGDGRLVDRGDALDHGAVAGDQLAGLDDHQVALDQLGGLAWCEPSCSVATVSWRMVRSVSAWARPRPSANASAMLANTTVSHSQIEMTNVYQAGSLPPSALPPNSLDEPGDGGDDGADLDDEHHRVADLHARVELDQAVEQRAPDDVGPEQRDRLALGALRRAGGRRGGDGHQRPPQAVEGEVELRAR